MANARKNHAHQVPAQLAASVDTITFERLAIANMTRSAAGTVDQPGTNAATKAGLNPYVLDAWLGPADPLHDLQGCKRRPDSETHPTPRRRALNAGTLTRQACPPETPFVAQRVVTLTMRTRMQHEASLQSHKGRSRPPRRSLTVADREVSNRYSTEQ